MSLTSWMKSRNGCALLTVCTGSEKSLGLETCGSSVVLGRCGLVSCWCGFVRLRLGVDGGALVLHVGHVAVVVVRGVSHCLDPPIREVDCVRPGHHLRVTVLVGCEVGPGVLVGDSILVRVRVGFLLLLDIGGCWAIGRWTIRQGRGRKG